MSDSLVVIENKVKELKEGLQTKQNFLANINEALKKLSNDKEVTIAEINQIQGAIHGYSESFRLLKESSEVVNSGATCSL